MSQGLRWRARWSQFGSSGAVMDRAANLGLSFHIQADEKAIFGQREFLCWKECVAV